MAGEWSKKIGEDGERICLKLMEIIGWSDLQTGLDIACVKNQEHERKKAHGLDGLYTYRSPLNDRLLHHVCISVKYHADKYPSGLNEKFKDHVKKLGQTINCFESSSQRADINKLWPTGIDSDECVGLVVWLNGDRSSDADNDLIQKFQDIRMPAEIELKHPVLLIDQHRANFIFESHSHAKERYPLHTISFNYHRTGNNNHDDERRTKGQKLPWELLSSGISIYRAERNQPDERNLIFSSVEKFSGEAFRKILSLAHHVSDNLANKIDICFPNYIDIEHGNETRVIKSSFEDSDFTNRVNVMSYKRDLRN